MQSLISVVTMWIPEGMKINQVAQSYVIFDSSVTSKRRHPQVVYDFLKRFPGTIIMRLDRCIGEGYGNYDSNIFDAEVDSVGLDAILGFTDIANMFKEAAKKLERKLTNGHDFPAVRVWNNFLYDIQLYELGGDENEEDAEYTLIGPVNVSTIIYWINEEREKIAKNEHSK